MKHGTRPAYDKGCRCDQCRAHKKAYNAAYHATNRAKHLARMSEYGKRRRSERTAWLAKIKTDRGCVDCGYNAHGAALDFDHLSDDKSFSVGHAGFRSDEVILAEIAKCEVVCANCHRIRTAERHAERKAAS